LLGEGPEANEQITDVHVPCGYGEFVRLQRP